MSDVRERRIELGGVSTRVLDLQGEDESLEPLLLLHGYSDSADTWRPLMAELAKAGRSVMALDMPGFGQADRLARDRPILPQLDRFGQAALRELATRSPSGGVVVGGNSLGGCVALRLAQRREMPLAGVVPIAPAGLDLAGWITIVEGAWAVQTVMRSPLPVPTAIIRELAGRTFRQLASSRPGALDPEVVKRFAASFETKRDVVRLLGTGRRLRPEIQDPFQLGWIECPVLVIWGENDRMVSPKGAERILAEIAHARAEIIESCGHCPQLEHPERVADLISSLALPPAGAARSSGSSRSASSAGRP